MTAYGYRLFTLKAFLGRSRTDLLFRSLSDGGADRSAAQEIERQLAGLKDVLLVGAPVYRNEPADTSAPEDDEGLVTKKHPYLVIREVERSGERVLVSVDYGREGDFEVLLSADGSREIALKGKAAARRYRIWFIAPNVGADGFVVSETKGRSHAASALVHWMRVRNQWDAVSFNGSGDRSEAAWVRWDTREAFDAHRLDEILTESSNHQITLKRLKIDDNADRLEGDLRLSQQGIPVTRLDDLKQVIMTWWANRAQKTIENRRQAATELGTILGVSDATSRLGFNDGEITFLEKNKTQTISPNTIERLFVYPLGDVPPSSDALLGEALATLGPIAEDLEIEIVTTI